jgi:hypothetical protein
MAAAEQLDLFPERICVEGIWGTVESRIACPGRDLAVVQFDGVHEWENEYKMASVAGCNLLVDLGDFAS